MINGNADEVVEEIFESLVNRYQINLKESMKDSEFHLLYYKYHKINLNRGGSYTDSPDWIKKQQINNKSHQKKMINAFNMLQQSQ